SLHRPRRRFDGGRLRHVRRYHEGLASETFDVTSRPFKAIRSPREQPDPRPLSRKGLRGGATNARRCTGNDHDFAIHARLASLSRQRSEEHTSELQSHLNLVCRLLLEKKNK